MLGLCTTGSSHPDVSTRQIFRELAGVLLVAREAGVAAEAEKAPYPTRFVIMVDGEVAAGATQTPTDGATAALVCEQAQIVLLADAASPRKL